MKKSKKERKESKKPKNTTSFFGLTKHGAYMQWKSAFLNGLHLILSISWRLGCFRTPVFVKSD
ncbi:hypothetical protein Nmel_001376 [Mimus melanotis]